MSETQIVAQAAQKIDKGDAVQIISEAAKMTDIIARAASDPAVDVAKLEKLLDMQERIMAKNAEMAFNAALARIAKKMPRIIKGGSVGYKEDKNDKKSPVIEAFKFARYEDIDKVVRPLLVEEGLSLSFNTDTKEGGGIIMHGTLSHIDGHSRTASIPLALDNTGGKNNVQGMGSTTSYGRRYTMCMLLNIVTVGEDDDGTGAEYVTHEQAVEIDLAAREVGINMPVWLKLLKVNSVPEILAKDYEKAKNLIEIKRKDNAKKSTQNKGK